MRRFLLLLVLVASLLSATEAVPVFRLSQVTTSQRDIPTKKSLRAADTSEGEDRDAEERNLLGGKALMSLSRAAKKFNFDARAKKLEHKAWVQYGESPQTLFKKYNWEGKSFAELKQDPNYLRYEGFDKVWLRAQHKKGTIMKNDEWVAKFQQEQAKRNTAP